MSTKIQTPEELAAESIVAFLSADASITAASIIVAALRKQAEQCRPYMRHDPLCLWDLKPLSPTDDVLVGHCTCGLDDVLKAMQ